MFKTFKLYVEEREEEDKHFRTMLLDRLGFEPKAMDDSTIKLRDLSRDRLKQAVSSLGLDSDTVQKLQNWIENNPDTTLQNLLSQMKGIPLGSDQPQSQDQQVQDIPSQPAELPQGQPKPMKPERRPAPAMYGGGPPVDAKLT